jgi:ribosomal-protein-alanine N-acetyltransferase
MLIDCGPCVVRSFRPEDAPSLALHANNRAVWLQLRDRFPHPYTLRDAELFIGEALAAKPETVFAIAVDDEAVGAVGVTPGTDVERVSAEIGYWLGEAHWGRGIATAALRAVTRHAFETFEFQRIFALPFAENSASKRVLEKAGYVPEGMLYHSSVKDGKLKDQFVYAFYREMLKQRYATPHAHHQ